MFGESIHLIFAYACKVTSLNQLTDQRLCPRPLGSPYARVFFELLHPGEPQSLDTKFPFQFWKEELSQQNANLWNLGSNLG